MPMILLQGYAREIFCRLAPSGSGRVPVLLNASRHPADRGAKARLVFNIFDATERAMYEHDLRRARDDAEELAAVIRSAQVGIFRVDASGRVKTCNNSAARMFGFDPPEAVGRPITELVPLVGEDDWIARFRPLVRSGEVPEFFDAETHDGRNLSISLTPINEAINPKPDPDLSILLRDTTERVQTERQLKITLQELNHRVKNNLAVVSGIARQTFRSEASAGETVRFMARLQSMAKAHDLLVANNWQSTSLRKVVLLATQDSGVDGQFDISGPEVVLPPQNVAMLALALFELVTNAMKYGALSCAEGRVRLHWSLTTLQDSGAPGFTLRWEEQGGPPVDTPTGHSGFGSKLVERLVAAELGGGAEIDFAPGGLIYTLWAPLAAA